MAFTVYFANSMKPENSTYQVDMTDKIPRDCTLKAGTSVSNPVIELQIPFEEFQVFSEYNVAYIPDFNRRYYFVTDWRYDGRRCICSLSVDVLASFWDALKTKQYYVTRSAYLTNNNIIDTEYPASAHQRTQSVSRIANPFQPPSTDYGCYIIGILSKYGGLDGAITYYVMGYLQFMTLMSKIFTINNYGQLGTTGTNNDTFTSNLAEAMINPLQYVASIMWYPFTTASLSGLGFLEQTQTVYCGYTTIALGVNVYRFDDATLYKKVTNLHTFTIPRHPDHNNANSFLNLSPYAEYRFSFYPFGTFTLEGEYLQGMPYLYCLWSVDLRSGRGIMNLGTSYTGSGPSSWKMPANFLTTEAQIGVPIPTSTIQTMIPDMGILGNTALVAGGMGLFNGLGSVVKSAFQNYGGGLGGMIAEQAGNLVSGAVSAIGSLADDVGNILNKSGIGSALLQTMSSPNMSGTQGSISLYNTQEISFSVWFKGRAGLDNLHFGSPLCQVVQLGTLAGFTVCSHAVANIYGATFAEKRKIENFLNTGFYIGL